MFLFVSFCFVFFFSTLRTKTYVRRYKHTYEYVQFVYKQKLLWKETKMKKSFLFFRVSICFCITFVKTDRFLLRSYEKGWGKRKYLYSFSFWEGESKRGTARANYNCTWCKGFAKGPLLKKIRLNFSLFWIVQF